ncbi:Fur family transcriptional regulator [Mycetocola zhadangensis]|uniref:Transcriptional repressor n=1 Tax=Mycetocola zhadangensis TaxID=1164595 RepID=A0A3L7IZR3_9MICO|nr:Fur family transcriptional regulator [Mycetocola zhadangensis]RLQ81508.1 transcriptional repressor [Mycetocola zhadangensis]RLQ82462.1 transcriptional repressor [Mycetocola zhadangensis]GGF01123.1 ferric uptake regulation protein FurA [Mycetocola zhadangensis]
MSPTEVSPERELLRSAGLRATDQRVETIRALEKHPHADAQAVFDIVLHELPDTSVQAIYGVLGALTDAGLVRRIEPAGSPARYELRVGDNHHHIVCSKCGAIGDVDCAVGHAPCLTPVTTSGFTLTTAEVTYWGLCPNCAAAPLS